MSRPAFLLAALLAAAPLAAAEEFGVSKALADALVDEMKRTVERLDMDGLGAPYFVSFTAAETRRLSIESSFGGLKNPTETRHRDLRVDLRVGGPDFDNMHYAGRDHWNYQPVTGSLVREEDYDALRYSIWLWTDRAYKTALERLSQKKAYKQNKLIKEKIPDLSKEPLPERSEQLPSDLPFERELWEKRLRGLSSLFKRYPAIQESKVVLYWIQRWLYFVDSEGRRVLKPRHDFELTLEAATQAGDGMRLKDYRSFIRHSLDEMPPYSLLEGEVLGLAKSVSELSAAPPVEDSYIGPVLLEDQAAGEFFNQLLAYNVSFPREIWLEDEGVKEEFHTGELSSRLGMRVLSPLLSVEDDPTLKRFGAIPLIGHYAVDDEGSPAKRVRLIDRGNLVDLLMSRSPTKQRAQSNGHGRADFSEHVSAHIGNFVITPHQSVPLPEMKQDLIKRAREFGLDHAYLVRRIWNENAREKEELLAAPILLYRVSVKDGSEELVRDAKFGGVTLRALRDIVAASPDRHVYNFYQMGPFKSPGRGQVQASIIHPSILVSELELRKSEKKPDKLPYLKHPQFAN